MEVGEMAERVVALEENVKHLAEKDNAHNDTLVRVESKIDRLVYWLMGTMATVVIFVIGLYVNMKG